MSPNLFIARGHLEVQRKQSSKKLSLKHRDNFTYMLICYDHIDLPFLVTCRPIKSI